jgi:hypothetical protein
MAPEINLDGQRKAEFLFSEHVEIKLSEIGRAKARPSATAEDALEASQN